MKPRRRGVALGTPTVLALLLVACGSDPGGGGGTPSGSNQAAGITCAKGSLTASGSTAQQNAMAQWIKNYLAQCNGANINYGGGGSGQGVQQFQQGTVDFAGSDFPLASGQEQSAANDRCKAGPAVNVPMVPGPIAIGYNVPGTSTLNLSASTLAKIFSDKVTNWNDPVIATDNPGVQLPSLSVQTFHRSDGSGTSYNFTNYLASDAPNDWTYGANKYWPAPGGQGSKGTQGIAQAVKSTRGAIGYVELSFATQNQIPVAKIGNASGNFVELKQDNVVAFLGKAKVVGTGNDLQLQFDYANNDPNAYPNVLVTYEILCQAGNPQDRLPLLKNFLGYTASATGQQQLAPLGYVPLPPELQQRVQQAVGSLS